MSALCQKRTSQLLRPRGREPPLGKSNTICERAPCTASQQNGRGDVAFGSITCIHLGSHVHPFYTEDGRLDQIRFFDYWLKGIDNGVMTEPPVKLAIRKGAEPVVGVLSAEWPNAVSGLLPV
jgi:hypothetical protein